MEINKENKSDLRFEQEDDAVWVFSGDSHQGTEISHLITSHIDDYNEDDVRLICHYAANEIDRLRAKLAKATPEGFVLELESWISVEIGTPAKFGTRVKIKRKSWDEEDNLVFIESEATYDKDSDFCELSNRSYEYETWFDHSLNKYLEEDELTHWMPLPEPPKEEKEEG